MHGHDSATALSALLAREQSEVTERQRQITESRTAITELLAARAASVNNQELPDVERLIGLEAVRSKIDKLAETCREIWSFNPVEPHSAEGLERGVRMRAIFPDSVRTDDPAQAHLQWMTGQGVEVRTVPTLPIRLILVDRSLAVVPLDDRNSDQGALVITGRGVVAGLVALFIATWRSARPLGARGNREPGPLSAQERTALRLWAQGSTDAMVARTLGISERTVRRISESLTDRLMARSRFEAGARAMHVGWLTAADLV